jgi:hypothetical protein
MANSDPKQTTDTARTDPAKDPADGPDIAPEPLDPEPLAMGTDDVNDFIDHYEDDEADGTPGRDVHTQVQPPL